MIYNLDGYDININNVIRRRNSIGIKIIDNNNIEVYSPYKLKDIDIINLVERHKRFIKKRIINMDIKDDVIHILGKEYKINIIISDFDNILVDDYLSEVRIYTKNNNDNHIFNIINEYYKNILINVVNKNIDNIKSEMNINFDITFLYKRVDSYFGECFNKKRIVIINTKMAKYDIKYILSVIYHELAHFYYQNHQIKFYNLLEKVFPGYKNIQKELRKIKYYEKY